ncbi:nuclear pore complex protein NUP98A isoform X1 [Ricinus communis]|uniref:nuclear pore complex protein NUP98A isoform X1 n=1 Tax=Ricinus communis TaxID=3988 RepID=UPI00077241D6|nr:nuclear pore complex protein NUP98A isoform X1 [Ricinus communis]|eukprot:XP_015574478.1 nuclear pore complex protein NUP98A isoform X2 [Ricinus communis]
MFGSNPFGQSSSSPFGQSSTSPFGQSSSSAFGSQSVFGQTNNGTNNPFAPKPFGTTTPFGSQTGGSIFGGTSTGMFGAPQTSSPFSSGATFGASSSPSFGGSVPAFGASSSPSFGSSSSFGGSSVFGQKPAFGAFGSATQTSPFGSTSQQSQPAFGSGLFGSTTPFGTSSQPAFGAASNPGFGSTSAPAFGASSAPSFGANSTLGFGANSTPSFGFTSTPTFGSTASAFGVSSSPVFGSGAGFGSSSAPVFGTSGSSGFGASSPAFGTNSSAPGFGVSTSAPAFGSTTTPSFGSAPAFGTSATPSFSFASSPSFGQSTSAFANSPFGTSSPFGTQATTPTFGNTGFGQPAFAGNRGGSRVVPYTATAETDSSSGQPGKLESISAMSVYKDKSHEELRWEDYQSGDKGGPVAPGQSSSGINFATSTAQSNPFAPSNTFAQTSASPFSSSVSSNPFSSKPFGPTSNPTFPSPFNTSSNPFQSTSAFASTSSSAFTSSVAPSPFGTTSSSAFTSTPSLFNSSIGQTNSSPFGNFTSTQSSLSFPSSTPAFTQTSSPFGQVTTSFTPSTASSFTQSSMFSTPSTGFGFSSSTSLMPSTNQGVFPQPSSVPFQLSQPSQPGALNFSNFGQSQAAGTSGFAGSSSIYGQSMFGPLSTTQSSVAVQPAPVTNPFGTLPAMPQMSIGRAGTTPSVQYGISSLPVVDKPAPVRISSLLTSRHLSQRRIRLPARKYNPKHDGPKVPFFCDEEETTGRPKADALFIPRENPRALVIRPTEQWPLRSSAEKAPPLKDASTPVYENGKILEAVDVPSSSGSSAKDKNMSEDGLSKERVHLKLNQKPNGVHEDNSVQKEELYMTLSGHRAGEAAIVYEHGADIEALMPKLRRSDYYTEPRIQELAAKERAEPGFCRHVKDFVVGRHGYGSIKFLGETDVRRLDLESLVQFNNREVIVYTDDSKKPPVGQGLNKPAEVTLLNIKCFDKKTGRQYTEGAKIEKYKEMLKRKAEEQGAEFVSYDPVKGEWKFRVNHFSKYGMGEEEEEEEEEEEDWIVLSARDC